MSWSETNPATEEIQIISDQVKAEVMAETGKCYDVFTAVKYKNRAANGITYLIKVFVGGGSYLHLSVFAKVSGDLILLGVQENHTDEDPLELF